MTRFINYCFLSVNIVLLAKVIKKVNKSKFILRFI